MRPQRDRQHGRVRRLRGAPARVEAQPRNVDRVARDEPVVDRQRAADGAAGDAGTGTAVTIPTRSTTRPTLIAFGLLVVVLRNYYKLL